MRAEDYFDKQAKNYNKERSSGFVGSLVKKEKEIALKLLDPKKNEKILDAGCGSGYFSIIIKSLGATPFGVDISQNMINELKKAGIEGKTVNIEELNLRKRFDKVLCAGALEFTNNPKKAFESLSKHLKKRGIFVLVYPKYSLAGYAYKMFHLSHRVKIKLFCTKRIRNLAKTSGFKVICIKKTDPICNVAMFKKVDCS